MDIKLWMEQFLNVMKGTFGGRLACVGLQGSRGRGEGGAASDIDVVVILDRLTMEDLESYRAAVADLPQRELLCGFVSGRGELACWDAADLFQFYHDTTPYLGSLDFLLPRISGESIRRAVHLGACNIYHACCHNYVHERETEILKSCCKSAFFILQAKHYLETGMYTARKADLLPQLAGADREILAALLAEEFETRFAKLTGLLMEWSSGLIRQGTCGGRRQASAARG